MMIEHKEQIFLLNLVFGNKKYPKLRFFIAKFYDTILGSNTMDSVLNLKIHLYSIHFPNKNMICNMYAL